MARRIKSMKTDASTLASLVASEVDIVGSPPTKKEHVTSRATTTSGKVTKGIEPRPPLSSAEETDETDPDVLFSKLPELPSLPAVKRTSLITFNDTQFQGKWLLLITTGNKRKDASSSLIEIWKHIDRFYDLDCLVFVLSTDDWANLVRFRCRKVLERGLGGRLDINLLAVQNMPQNRIALGKMGVINEDSEAPNGWKFCYPAYMLYCPDKTLVEKVVLKDEDNRTVTCTVHQPSSYSVFEGRPEKSIRSGLISDPTRNDSVVRLNLLSWPITEEDVEWILTKLKTLKPVYDMARGCGVSFEEFVLSCNKVVDKKKVSKTEVKNKKLRKLLKEVNIEHE